MRIAPLGWLIAGGALINALVSNPHDFAGPRRMEGMSRLNKSKAGKSSGVKRAKLAALRRFLVLTAFEELKPTYRAQPFSDKSIKALVKQFRTPPTSSPDPDFDSPLAEYETIVRPLPAHSDKWEGMMMEIIDRDMRGDSVDVANYVSLRRASRDTIIKDLKVLGIRSKRRKQHSG